MPIQATVGLGASQRFYDSLPARPILATIILHYSKINKESMLSFLRLPCSQEERLAQLDSSRIQALERQPENASEDPFSPRHRNYQSLSARSPDDFEDEGPDEDDRDKEQLEVVEDLGGEAGVSQ